MKKIAISDSFKEVKTVTDSEIKGTHIIADEVIAAIVLNAAAEASGVYLPSTIANGLAERFGKKQSTKGIRIDQQEDGAIIEMKVVADYGINIPEACKMLQEKVSEKVSSLTGKKVLAVNIQVTDINTNSIPSAEND